MLAPSLSDVERDTAEVTRSEILPDSPPGAQLITPDSIEIGSIEIPLSESSGAVYDSIALGLDFSKGFSFAKEIKRLFASTVHPSDDSFKFKMVVSFGRAAFRLTEDIVAVALEAAIGGYCGSLQVCRLSDRVFSFVVASKKVGFYVLNSKFFACDKFKCYFHLWSNGGPDWLREWRLWQENSEKEWTLVSPSKKRAQLALKALAKPRPKSAIKHTVSLAKTLKFAPTIQYEAHKGYGPKIQESKGNAAVYWTKSSPSIKFATAKPFVLPENELQKELDQNLVPQVQPNLSVSDQRPDLTGLEVDDQRSELTGLEEVVEDIAFRFWKCRKCLSMSHTMVNCTNKIRCRDCFNYGHIAKDCLKRQAKSRQQWVPKRKAPILLGRDLRSQLSQPIAAVSSPISQPENLPGERNQGNPSALPIVSFQSSTSPPPSAQAMVNFEVEPTPWLPWGHHVIDGGPTRLPRSFYYPAQDPPQTHHSFCIA
jgi:hypothetical protein